MFCADHLHEEPRFPLLGEKAGLLVRHIVAGTLQRRSTPLVVDLRGCDVSMAKKILHLRNVDTEIEQPGGTCCPQAMGRVDALAVGSLSCLDGLHRTGVNPTGPSWADWDGFLTNQITHPLVVVTLQPVIVSVYHGCCNARLVRPPHTPRPPHETAPSHHAVHVVAG